MLLKNHHQQIYLGEYLLNIAKGYNLLDAKLNISFELEATESEKMCGDFCIREGGE